MALTKQEEEIQEVIKKNLPAHVGDILKERLTQADKDADELKREKILTKDLQKNIEGLEESIKGFKKKEEQYQSLLTREEALATATRNLEVEKLKYELAIEKEKTIFTQNVAMGLVRNTSYRKTIFDTENPGGQGMQDGNGIWHYPMPMSKHYTEDKQEE